MTPRASTPPTEPDTGCVSPIVAAAVALAVATALLGPLLGPLLGIPAAIAWVTATAVLGTAIGRLLRRIDHTDTVIEDLRHGAPGHRRAERGLAAYRDELQQPPDPHIDDAFIDRCLDRVRRGQTT